MKDAVSTVEIEDLPLFRRGKVRDVYDLGESLLLVATDRISCFDVVLGESVPGKGIVLTAISRFWFDFLHDVPNHLLTEDLSVLPPEADPHLDALRGRSMIVRKCEVIPVEWVVRGYLVGSGYREYRETGSVCGQRLPEGLVSGARLSEPIVTPTTKAETGHDEPISIEEAIARSPDGVGEKVVEASRAIYERAAVYAAERGVLLADTKFEWGMGPDGPMLIDEVLTPDSSRYWDRAAYDRDGEMISYDKQFVRDHLESVGWNKESPAPVLPAELIERTSEKYDHLRDTLLGTQAVADRGGVSR